MCQRGCAVTLFAPSESLSPKIFEMFFFLSLFSQIFFKCQSSVTTDCERLMRLLGLNIRKFGNGGRLGAHLGVLLCTEITEMCSLFQIFG